MQPQPSSASSPESCASLLRGALDATADGILVVDRQDRLVTHNENFLALWNIPGDLARLGSNQTLIGYIADQLCAPDRFLDMIRENQAHPERECFLTVPFKDGRVLERVSRPHWLDDQIVGRVVAFRDVSERERLIAQLQETIRERDQLLSMAAHELRAPISSMRLAVQSLRSGRLPPEATPPALDIIDRGQRRVAALVDKLLDLGHIRSGTLKLDLEPTDLVEIVQEVVARHQEELRRSGSTVQVGADDSVVGNWDRLRLDQIVTNLLSNAIKFGSGKPIEVDVRARAGRGVLVVRDRGIGVPHDVQRRIFKAFHRAVSNRNFEGLGLGLHIVQTIVQGLGGTVTVTSEPGSGATFQVELPQGWLP